MKTMSDSSRLTESDGTPSSANQGDAAGAEGSPAQTTQGHGTQGHGTEGHGTEGHGEQNAGLAEGSGERPSPKAPGAEDLVGQTIRKYEIVGLVGRGGMGCVYEAINTSIQKRVAMKVIDQELAKNDEATARFQREALAASAVESPQIVQIFDAGFTEGGTPFIVMELLRGRDLGDVLKERGRLSPGDVLPIVAQILKGLHYAHEAGIVHRDLKPDNVFLCQRDDEPLRVKLLDFGVSKIARDGRDVPLQTLTRQGTVVGTPYYMSPEQAQAFPDVDGRTDIYSVGAILYECLVGRPPHIGKSYEQVIVNICMKDVAPVDEQNPEVGTELAEVIHKALSKEREDRFESARDFLQALADIAPDSVRISSPSGSLERLSLSAAKSNDGVVATPPSPLAAGEVSDELAQTVHADDSVEHATIEHDEMEEALRRSGQSEKLRQSGTQAVSTVRTPAHPIAGVPKKPKWTLALALGVALLIGAVLVLSFVGDTDESDRSQGSRTEKKAVVVADDLDPDLPGAAPAPEAQPPPAASSSASAVASSKPPGTEPKDLRPVAKKAMPRVQPKAPPVRRPPTPPPPAPPLPEPPTSLVAPKGTDGDVKKPELELQTN